jgi:prolyl-tRNA synthetase
MSREKFTIEAKKEEDFSSWYKEVLIKGEVMDYHDVSGCYVLRPNGFLIWKVIREYFDEKLAGLGVEEAYFPMLVSKAALEKEKAHVENFTPEVAWIKECGGKPLEEPVAIRPTSETIIYPYFAKWIRSYRDLPVKINQWCNVLRWETTQTTPFIRSREFLWQEGHTVHLTREDADKEVMAILEFYRLVYEEVLAVPVLMGRKSKKETFAGADYTTTVEAFIPETGRAIQGATSHSLGTNFSRMFKVVVEDPSSPGTHIPLFQNSWGISTRSIGVCIMTHSDNKGLVLPPRVAPVQAVIVPCGVSKKTSEEERGLLDKYIQRVEASIRKEGVRVKSDLSTNVSPGHKFNHWESMGVPVRVEVGPRDMKEERVSVVWRLNGERKTLGIEGVGQGILKELRAIHNEMYAGARTRMESRIVHVREMKEVFRELNEKRLVLFSWCGDVECEDSIKEATTERDSSGGVVAMGAKSICIPFDTRGVKDSGGKCIKCPGASKGLALFGRSY